MFRLPVKAKRAVTVKVVEPLIAPKAASIVVCPTATAVASPVVLIVATPGADELHAAALVTLCVLASLYVPVAVNCCVANTMIKAFAGVTVIDSNAGPVTERVVEPRIEFKAAAIVVPPGETLVASPAALIVATPGADELHAAVLVRFCVLPSL